MKNRRRTVYCTGLYRPQVLKTWTAQPAGESPVTLQLKPLSSVITGQLMHTELSSTREGKCPVKQDHINRNPQHRKEKTSTTPLSSLIPARTQHRFSLRPHPNLSISRPHRCVGTRASLCDLWQLQPQVAWVICQLCEQRVSPAALLCVLSQTYWVHTVQGKSVNCSWCQIKTFLTEEGESADVSSRVWLLCRCVHCAWRDLEVYILGGLLHWIWTKNPALSELHEASRSRVEKMQVKYGSVI